MPALPKFLLLPLLIFIIFPLFSNSSYGFIESETGPYVAVRLLPEKTQVKGGEQITIGIEQTIADGWHTYWLNAGDSGAAPRITWSGLEGLSAGDIEWPVPHRMPMGPLVNFGYEKNAVLLQTLTLPETLPDGPLTITAKADILVCKDICIPESHSASFVLNGAEEPVPEAVSNARQKLPVFKEIKGKVSERDGNLILTIPSDALLEIDSTDLFPESWGLIDNTQTTSLQRDDNTLTLAHPRGDRPLSEADKALSFVLGYDDESGQRQGVKVTLDNQSAQNNAADSHAAQSVPLGLIGAIVFAILGGMILNLMPCVFPVLSLKALSLVSLGAHDEQKARAHGLAYTAGILLCFGLIAGLLIALKSAGAQIGWGFQLQNPAVILALGYLFLLIGLNLFGLFEIDFKISNLGGGLTRKDGLTGSFFTGVLATLVATPCTAPFMGAAMGYALTQPAFYAMIVFLSLGFGLALPYLALTFIPALRRVLPKPGAWMETFRQFLAFPMIGAALFLFWVLVQQVDAMAMGLAFTGALTLVMAVWLLKLRPKNKGVHFIVIALIVACLGLSVAAVMLQKHAPQSSMENDATRISTPFTTEAYEAALAGDFPVFVNMTAAWCISCKVNERVAIYTPATQTLFKDHNVVYLKGDWTNQDPAITKFLESYGRNGVPLYVYYGPKKSNGERPEPKILPQILTPGLLEQTLTP
jgi:thiol:disulfide interchange protein